jgi:hypothetical protein
VKKIKLRLVAGTALASGAAWLALGTPAFPSVYVSSASPPASVDLQTQATLQAKGARITVPVTFLCPGDANEATLYVSVSQRSGSVINAGSWSHSVSCTGKEVLVKVPVTADYKPFKKGTAAATAELDAYRWDWPTWNIHLDDNEIIQIK